MGQLPIGPTPGDDGAGVSAFAGASAPKASVAIAAKFATAREKTRYVMVTSNCCVNGNFESSAPERAQPQIRHDVRERTRSRNGRATWRRKLR